MTGLPWSKFFWSDYAADPALKLCSFAAQGLWMRMLCIAAEHEPAGYVAVNGRGLDAKGIARITGGSIEEVETLLDELAENNVFSRDRRGWIYSRRLINDTKRRRKASEDGKKGGNPKLCKDKENLATLKGEDKGEEKQEAKPQSPEARDSVDKSTDGVAVDPLKELFDLGISILTSSGHNEKQARSLIGKWRKAKSDADVLTALLDCRTRAISNPVEWLEKRFNGARWVSQSGFEYRGDDQAVMREAERRADWGTYYAVKRSIEEASKPKPEQRHPKPNRRSGGVSSKPIGQLTNDLLARAEGRA